MLQLYSLNWQFHWVKRTRTLWFLSRPHVQTMCYMRTPCLFHDKEIVFWRKRTFSFLESSHLILAQNLGMRSRLTVISIRCIFDFSLTWFVFEGHPTDLLKKTHSIERHLTASLFSHCPCHPIKWPRPWKDKILVNLWQLQCPSKQSSLSFPTTAMAIKGHTDCELLERFFWLYHKHICFIWQFNDDILMRLDLCKHSFQCFRKDS